MSDKRVYISEIMCLECGNQIFTFDPDNKLICDECWAFSEDATKEYNDRIDSNIKELK